MKKSNKSLIKKLKSFWKEISKIEENYYESIRKLEEKMQKETNIEDLEIFICDGECCGIVNYSRTMKLIHRHELEED